jgi:exodeoxyribonuclease VII large subunit
MCPWQAKVCYNGRMWVRSVSQVTRYIKALIDGDPELSGFWVRGEVSNFQRATSGHCYFTLKDSESELRAVMWRSVAIQQNWLPSQGNLVDAYGSVSVYERGGAYQFYAESLAPVGEGQLWEEYQRLRERLAAEGLFSKPARPMPRWPRRIGVVTSPTGAAWHDIQRVVQARYPLAELVLAPTLVQGSEAPRQIVRAIQRISLEPDIDVLIVARGGGSLEDLWAFNDEGVARALAASRVPVVSGVGHETDYTIADLVADLRAPTPSGAAAMVTPDGAVLREQIRLGLESLHMAARRRLDEFRRGLAHAEQMLRLHHPRRAVAEQMQRVDQNMDRMGRALGHRLALRRAQVANGRARLEALSPSLVLGRGYAVVEQRATGQRLSSVAQARPADALLIHLRDGQIDAEVTDIRSITVA